MTDVFPLKISENGRHFVDCSGKPYFIFADTGWMIFANINEEDADFYLEARRRMGINTILCYAAPFRINHTNIFGQPAFFNQDLSQPNEKYFEHVDKIISLAAQKNMLLIIGPVEMGDYKEYYTVQNAEALGRYFGRRYRDYANIMWFCGGDIHPGQREIDICDALARGLLGEDQSHLISFHPGGGKSSSDWFNSRSWLDFNMVQVMAPESPKAYTWMLADYKKRPLRPTVLAEPCYEDNDDLGTPPKFNTPFQVRRYVTWAVLSGGCGIFYGHKYVYKYLAEPFWKDFLTRPAFRHFANLGKFLMKREWHKLAPDWAHTTLIKGFGNYDELDYAAAARAGDGSFAVVYLPSARPVTINMSRFNSSKTAKWFDMTDNTITDEGTYPNSGLLELPARPANKEGNYDWILILE